MKVVLKADVKGTGKKDQVVEVSTGYARNFLFPRGLAIEANAAALNEVETKANAQKHREEMALSDAQALAAKLNGKTVVIHAKAGQGGRMFGAVTAKDIAEAAAQLIGQPVDKRKVVLDKEIKSFGSYTVDVKVHPGVSAQLTAIVKE